MRYTYTRLYADDQGESHFADIDIELTAVDFAPPAPPLCLSPAMPASLFRFLGAAADWDGSIPHPSPSRQVFTTLSGTYRVTASDGTVRDFPAGAVLLLEDTTGKGHSTRIVGGEPAFFLVARLPSEPR